MDPTTVVCVFCEQPMLEAVENGETIYHFVQGWERDREQGGTNALRLRSRTGDVAHSRCVERAAAGVAAGQETLV